MFFSPMSDYFALLNEPRRPWLDPDLLKQKFLALASDAHPDRGHGANESEKAEITRHYAQLNAAYHCLAEPKSRLLHLLELELGVKPKDIQQIPAGLADLFAEVATTCNRADHLLAEKSRATSPLLQVQFVESGHDWVERLNLLKKRLGELHGKLEDDLKSLDEKWMIQEAVLQRELLTELEEIYRLFSYFNRWNGQIQERIVQLSF
jgi:curved DNA-binding protein CbpA